MVADVGRSRIDFYRSLAVSSIAISAPVGPPAESPLDSSWDKWKPNSGALANKVRLSI